VCLQNLPVVFALDRSGFVSDDGETHQGLFDISLFRSAPNMIILAPAGKEELEAMLDWSLSNNGPAIIRYPKDACPMGDPAFSEALEKGRGVWIRPPGASCQVCIAFTGSLYEQVMDGAEKLASMGIDAGLYNLRFLKPIDEDYLADIMNAFELVVFVEEGVKPGGFGEYAAELALSRNCSARVLVLPVKEKFTALGKRRELLRLNGLDGEGIAAFVSHVLSPAYAWGEP
jgi:1-deoxy-D-xylulose-5-phosphate synthase